MFFNLLEMVYGVIVSISKKQIDAGNAEFLSQYEYSEVTVFMPLTANKVLQAVIAEEWDADYEQKLLNEYNTAILGGIYDDSTAEKKKAAYKDFLRQRAELKTLVEKDC